MLGAQALGCLDRIALKFALNPNSKSKSQTLNPRDENSDFGGRGGGVGKPKL